jgi:hypothetical protein
MFVTLGDGPTWSSVFASAHTEGHIPISGHRTQRLGREGRWNQAFDP